MKRGRVGTTESIIPIFVDSWLGNRAVAVLTTSSRVDKDEDKDGDKDSRGGSGLRKVAFAFVKRLQALRAGSGAL